MRSRSIPRLTVLAGLALATVLTAAACVPEAPAPTTTSTTSSTLPGGNQPPVAVASATTPAPGYFGLPVSFSSAGSTDSDGTIVSYSWDFGSAIGTSNGYFSAAPSPVAAYPQPGPYTATLTVTDDDGATGSTTVVVAAPAPVGDVVLFQNPVVIPTLPGEIAAKVWWNNQDPNTLIFISVCRKSKSDPTFNVALDCAPLSEQNLNGSASGSGFGGILPIFRGEEPSGDGGWGLYTASDVAPPGIQKVTTGYIRVTNNILSNNDEAKELAFTLSAS